MKVSISSGVTHNFLKAEEELERLRRIQQELLTGQRKVEKVAIAGNIKSRIRIELLKSHRPILEFTLNVFLTQQDNHTPMPSVGLNFGLQGTHRLLGTFQALHEVPILI